MTALDAAVTIPLPLLEALLRHCQDSAATARADLLHERDRVDRLTSGLLQIAIHATPRPGQGAP